MAKKQKFDGVVEAVHYNSDGMVKWVRVYVRRGPTYSDRVIVPRQELIDTIKSGKSYLGGRRVPLLASTFDVSSPIRVVGALNQEVLVNGTLENAAVDTLDGVPVV
jgi:hypothetical protein